MHNVEKSRPVRRVLVMLDYGDGQPDSGEVFDLTALSRELAENETQHHHASIELTVCARRDYDQPAPGVKLEASWQAMIRFRSSGDSAHLDDAINASMPDSFATDDLRKKLKRVEAKAEKLKGDIQIQRLMDVAKVRSQHPIARVTENPMLPAIASQV